jgi:hypothetical protein
MAAMASTRNGCNGFDSQWLQWLRLDSQWLQWLLALIRRATAAGFDLQWHLASTCNGTSCFDGVVNCEETIFLTTANQDSQHAKMKY